MHSANFQVPPLSFPLIPFSPPPLLHVHILTSHAHLPFLIASFTHTLYLTLSISSFYLPISVFELNISRPLTHSLQLTVYISD